MSTRYLRIIGGVAVLAGLVPVSGNAQATGRIVFTPFAGAYVPTNDVLTIKESGGGITMTGAAKQRTSPAFGMNVSYWLSDRAAIEVGGLYANSEVRGTITGTDGSDVVSETLDDNAHVWLGSAKVLYHILPPENRFTLRFGLGPAFINRGGSAYDSDDGGKVTGLTDFGAAMSLCTRIAVTPTLGLRLRAENFLYQTKLGFRDAGERISFDKKTQNDLVFSAGLQLFLNR